MRMARELHDVLAHSISVINVQAGVALALIDEHPEQVRAALTTIKAASKEALGEVRQVLSTLRAPGEAPRSPVPGLDRLPELLEQAAFAGLSARVTVEGTSIPLPSGADLAAFRIVQEALTNIVRHSGSRTARVLLAYRPGAVEVRVDDDGPAVAGGESGGNGLVGMRERAAALGGTVETGPRPDGGFRVRATLPLAASDRSDEPERREPAESTGPSGRPDTAAAATPSEPPEAPESSEPLSSAEQTESRTRTEPPAAGHAECPEPSASGPAEPSLTTAEERR
jgi:nitrate/nitrite-specific signal transduction histidine kinase